MGLVFPMSISMDGSVNLMIFGALVKARLTARTKADNRNTLTSSL
jgi:hypothetical protein